MGLVLVRSEFPAGLGLFSVGSKIGNVSKWTWVVGDPSLLPDTTLWADSAEATYEIDAVAPGRP